MILPKHELSELLVNAESHGLALSDLAGTCDKLRIAPTDLLNELSVAVAHGYLQRALSYDFCDAVMNGIIGAVVEVGMTDDMPQPAFALYQAFDQGEWIRRYDPPETNPAEKYTRPMVEQIMRKLRG
ncbi:hypothetical protein [Pseudomonas sp. TWP3-2]|uniref:hypothetical protein n=1 Tax=Pseudomonas sp. TWP3-2 TaxID=2804574 RepID=UPI003CE8EFF3